jgi:hypothetical protein
MTPLLVMSLGNYMLASAIYIHDGPTLPGLALFLLGIISAVFSSFIREGVRS